MDSPAEASSKASLGLEWVNRFTHLGETFFTRLKPTELPAVHWVSCNLELAKQIGLDEDWHNQPSVLKAFSGCEPLLGSEPLASVYSGHQFGHWAGQLGDGRAIYLGEIQTPVGNFEIQLKGAGKTPYSRSGDGRAVLRSSIREYLCSEAMHGLGIPTTRALCITGSSGVVYREEVERAAVVTRMAPSFIRFGHFEHFAAKGDTKSLKTLADFVIANYSSLLADKLADNLADDHALLPTKDEALKNQLTQNPYALLLYRVTLKTAKLIAHWQSVGFCHGVMNTDNMSILGLTLDYGPFQFMDSFVLDHICNHTDSEGRYAYDQQPNVAYWNLYCLGQALLPLIADKDLTVKCLDEFKVVYPRYKQEIFLKKLGLSHLSLEGTEQARELVNQIEKVMALENIDFTIFWRSLSHAVKELTLENQKTSLHRSAHLETLEALITVPDARLAWQKWCDLFLNVVSAKGLDLEELSNTMLRVNPKYVLRNHLGEAAIKSAEKGDFSEIEILLKILKSPFDEHPAYQAYAELPPEWASSISISCSS